MKHFTLAVVVLALFASVALAKRPSLTKKPVKPVPEPADKSQEEAATEEAVKLDEKAESAEEVIEEVKSKKNPLAIPQMPKPVHDVLESDDDEADADEAAESTEKKDLKATAESAEASEEVVKEVKEKGSAKKPLPGATKPKPSAADLGVKAPEHVTPEESTVLVPPTITSSKKKPKPSVAKA